MYAYETIYGQIWTQHFLYGHIGQYKEIFHAQLSNAEQFFLIVVLFTVYRTVSANQIIFQKNPCDEVVGKNMGMELILSTIILYVIDENGNFDAAMTQNLPNLYSQAPFESRLTVGSFFRENLLLISYNLYDKKIL